MKKEKEKKQKVAQKPKGSFFELKNEQLPMKEAAELRIGGNMQLNDTSCPISHWKYPRLLGCILQSRHCSTPVKGYESF